MPEPVHQQLRIYFQNYLPVSQFQCLGKSRKMSFQISFVVSALSKRRSKSKQHFFFLISHYTSNPNPSWVVKCTTINVYLYTMIHRFYPFYHSYFCVMETFLPQLNQVFPAGWPFDVSEVSIIILQFSSYIAYLTIVMLEDLPPYLFAHIFFKSCLQTKIGVAWSNSLCASLLCLVCLDTISICKDSPPIGCKGSIVEGVFDGILTRLVTTTKIVC